MRLIKLLRRLLDELYNVVVEYGCLYLPEWVDYRSRYSLCGFCVIFITFCSLEKSS